MSERLAIIPIDQIHTNPYQPRHQFDQEALNDLSTSISKNGLIQPIIVRESPISGYELIAGERRLRASQLAGLTDIKAIIRSSSDQESRTQALVENIQRSDLNPIEEALAIENLLKQEGATHESIAKDLGKSRPYVSNSLRLLQLPKDIQTALVQEKISAGHGRLLIGLSKKEQAYWLERILTEALSVRKLETLLKQASHPQLPKTPREKNPDIKIQEEWFKQQLGLAVTIDFQEKQGKGQMTISFNSLEEFDRLIHSFKSD
ncbi:ParB/RepB/Spo0J family partition protein [Streptococcus sp. DD12]|uniref:ParB/RepB/Spo0J family partition protein n=1 Tax=Streptococcus sp. DD12 TaxID=1777880 RepID=UPI0007975BDF|nr:ParB/RepB/Spo0J family partition protein [Streptococcus sp. DD12]KXT76110.1 Chromosome (plasmid) partitioning protein ParB / Stage 0 sporulation protein J [Streptococcus sp. DD12]